MLNHVIYWDLYVKFTLYSHNYDKQNDLLYKCMSNNFTSLIHPLAALASS